MLVKVKDVKASNGTMRQSISEFLIIFAFPLSLRNSVFVLLALFWAQIPCHSGLDAGVSFQTWMKTGCWQLGGISTKFPAKVPYFKYPRWQELPGPLILFRTVRRYFLLVILEIIRQCLRRGGTSQPNKKVHVTCVY